MGGARVAQAGSSKRFAAIELTTLPPACQCGQSARLGPRPSPVKPASGSAPTVRGDLALPPHVRRRDAILNNRIIVGRPASDNSLRLEVESAISKAYAECGADGVKTSVIVRPFLSCGVGRSTLYRWADRLAKAKKPGPAMIRAAQKAAAVRKHRAESSGGTPGMAAASVAAKLIAGAAVLPSVDVVAGPGLSARDVIRRVQLNIEAAEQVMAFARYPGGKVKVSRTLLAASEHLRRSLETALKVHTAMRAVADIEEFREELIAMVGDVAAAYPPAGELLLSRMRGIGSRWRG